MTQEIKEIILGILTFGIILAAVDVIIFAFLHILWAMIACMILELFLYILRKYVDKWEVP